MDNFLIESPHRAEDCVNVVQLVHAQGYLTHFDWGRLSSVHPGWAIIEAGSEAERVSPFRLLSTTRLAQAEQLGRPSCPLPAADFC
jgi:hypothetical protein